MADLARLLRETIGASYYRTRPVEAGRYTASKVRFRASATTTDTILDRLGFDPLRARAGLDVWADELNAAIERSAGVSAAAEDQGSVSIEGALLTYSVVRSLRPDVVVETGVASGISSAFIGAALLENDHGRLISIDLPPAPTRLADGAHYDWRGRGVGWAMPDAIRDRLGDRWKLVLEDVRTSLPRVVEEVGTLDLFVHDDLHTPDHMHWEFDLVWPHLAPGGVILADDVNHGWLAFADSVGQLDTARWNVRRFAGLRKPPDAAATEPAAPSSTSTTAAGAS